MKRKITLALLVASVFANAQSPINMYYGSLTAVPADGADQRYYAVVQSATPLDQSATGGNLTWNFTDLSAIGTSSYFVEGPTAEELSAYPGTMHKVRNVVVVGDITSTSNAYVAIGTDGSTSVTGTSSGGLTLNFSTNNAFIGNFPLEYGETSTDPVAGTYSYETYSGTFTGTSTTTVDAYGTLNTSNVFGPISAEVTRVKIVQDISLNYLIFTNVGTITRTAYHYYRLDDLFPYFTTVTTVINVPMASIDQTVNTIEHAVPALLATPENQDTSVVIAPNPVEFQLNVAGVDSASVQVFDLTGRKVLEGNLEGGTMDVSQLQSGQYIAVFGSGGNSLTKKFIKK